VSIGITFGNTNDVVISHFAARGRHGQFDGFHFTGRYNTLAQRVDFNESAIRPYFDGAPADHLLRAAKFQRFDHVRVEIADAKVAINTDSQPRCSHARGCG
jgi:hypothetical protein